MSVWRLVGAIGRLLVGAGTVILLFVVYLLWGTGISEANHQHALKSQFDGAIAEHERVAQDPSSTTVPSSASALVRQLVAGEAPAEGQPIAVIDIPKIGVEKIVVQGTATADLHLGPGHYPGTPLPGQSGNAAIAGHRTTYGAPFYNLNELVVGDAITITTLQGIFTYRVTQTEVVSPTDVSVLDPSLTPMLTLTTCNPRFSAAQRLVVQAAMVVLPGRVPAPALPQSPSAPSPTRLSGELAGSEGPWAGAALWGAGTLVLGVAVWLLARRRRSTLMRWSVYGAGALPLLVLLYFFFENVSPLLPASF